MKKNKYAILSFTLMLLATFFITACSSNEPEQVVVTKVVEQEVVVTEEVVVTQVVEVEVEVPVVPEAPEELHESPELHAKVEAGELPPLAERLPTEPRVLQTFDTVGTYGGTWHRFDTSLYHVGTGYVWPLPRLVGQ